MMNIYQLQSLLVNSHELMQKQRKTAKFLNFLRKSLDIKKICRKFASTNQIRVQPRNQ